MNQSDTFTELRSEEVQELLSRPPKWLLRWGITVVLLVLAVVFAGSWIVHYPDLVRASFKLTSANTPKAVLTRTDGKLVRLFVQEGQSVQAGAVLAAGLFRKYGPAQRRAQSLAGTCQSLDPGQSGSLQTGQS